MERFMDAGVGRAGRGGRRRIRTLFGSGRDARAVGQSGAAYRAQANNARGAGLECDSRAVGDSWTADAGPWPGRVPGRAAALVRAYRQGGRLWRTVGLRLQRGRLCVWSANRVQPVTDDPALRGIQSGDSLCGRGLRFATPAPALRSEER